MRLAGHFYETAIATTRTALGGNFAVKMGGVIGPHHDLAACAASGSIGLDGGVGADEGALGIVQCAIAAMLITTNQHRAAATAARGVDGGIEVEFQLPSGGMHPPAVALHAGGRHLTAGIKYRFVGGADINQPAIAVDGIGAQCTTVDNFRAAQRQVTTIVTRAGGGDVDLAGIKHRCRRPHADQAHLATLLVDAAGLDEAFVVDRAIKNLGSGAGGDQDLATVSLDLTAVDDLVIKLLGVVDHRLINFETQ